MSTAHAPDQAPPSLGARPSLRRIEAVVNAASGGVGPGAAEALAALVAEHGYALNLAAPAPDEVGAAVKAAVDAAPDLVLILAGDGTARLAAELSGPDGPLIAPLPGGTMNMLPHALYGNVTWQAALAAALTTGEARDVCGGRVGERAFYVAAILGAPALWGHAREAMRAGDLRAAWRRTSYALSRAFTGEVRYRLDAKTSGEAEALVLLSPMVSKTTKHEEALQVAALGVKSAQDAFRLAVTGLVRDWRDDPGVTVGESLRGRVWAQRAIPCILDGETQRLSRQVEFEFIPRAFRALATS
jgi:diacylglycerol kinase family enzyme